MQALIQWLKTYKSWFILTLASGLLLIAQSTYWLNHTIFNQEAFTTIVSESINTEDGRQAIAQTVVNRSLEDSPIVRRLFGETATQLVAGLLGTDIANQSLSTVVNRTYAFMTTENPQPITIDLLAIKSPLVGLVNFAQQQGREVRIEPSNLPDSIEIFNPANLPNFYKYSVWLLWISPLFWASAFILFGLYIYRGRKSYEKRVYIVGTIIIVSSLLGMLTGPLLPPPVVAMVPVIEIRVLVENVIKELLQPFMMQLVTTILLTAATLLIFSQRFVITRFAQRITTHVKHDNFPKHKQKRPR